MCIIRYPHYVYKSVIRISLWIIIWIKRISYNHNSIQYLVFFDFQGIKTPLIVMIYIILSTDVDYSVDNYKNIPILWKTRWKSFLTPFIQFFIILKIPFFQCF